MASDKQRMKRLMSGVCDKELHHQIMKHLPNLLSIHSPKGFTGTLSYLINSSCKMFMCAMASIRKFIDIKCHREDMLKMSRGTILGNFKVILRTEHGKGRSVQSGSLWTVENTNSDQLQP